MRSLIADRFREFLARELGPESAHGHLAHAAIDAALLQEREAKVDLYPTCGRAVLALPAPLPPREGAEATTIAAAPMLARGSVSTHPAAVSRDRAGQSDPAPGADLTGQGANALASTSGREHGQCQGGLSRGPVTSAVPGAGSRTAPVHKNAPAELVTRGRMTHRSHDSHECNADY